MANIHNVSKEGALFFLNMPKPIILCHLSLDYNESMTGNLIFSPI